MLTIGPDVPDGLRPLLGEMLDALRTLKAPGAPSPVFACASAALPPPKAWRQCVALVTDLNILAHSDGFHWIRQDTGGVI